MDFWIAIGAFSFGWLTGGIHGFALYQKYATKDGQGLKTVADRVKEAYQQGYDAAAEDYAEILEESARTSTDAGEIEACESGVSVPPGKLLSIPAALTIVGDSDAPRKRSRPAKVRHWSRGAGSIGDNGALFDV